MRQDELMQTDDGQKTLEGNGRGTRDHNGVTEHQVGVGRKDGGGAIGDAAGECVCGFSTI